MRIERTKKQTMEIQELKINFKPKSVLRENSPRSTHALLCLSDNYLVEHNGRR